MERHGVVVWKVRKELTVQNQVCAEKTEKRDAEESMPQA